MEALMEIKWHSIGKRSYLHVKAFHKYIFFYPFWWKQASKEDGLNHAGPFSWFCF